MIINHPLYQKKVPECKPNQVAILELFQYTSLLFIAINLRHGFSSVRYRFNKRLILFKGTLHHDCKAI